MNNIRINKRTSIKGKKVHNFNGQISKQQIPIYIHIFK